MSALGPSFMTVTYGAGGGTRESTRELTHFVATSLQIPAVAHLTCVSHSRDDIERILNELEEAGVHHVLALRGDPPKGEKRFVPHPQGFQCARDLTEFIARRGGFSIAVAGYPEGHPEASYFGDEMRYLKEKIDSGAEVVLTQLFFEPELFFRFRDRAHKQGIAVPLIPGIMPVSNAQQLRRFTSLCGASLPEKLTSSLDSLGDSAEKVRDFGVQYAFQMVTELLRDGSPGIHFYTLNKSFQVAEILSLLETELLLSRKSHLAS